MAFALASIGTTTQPANELTVAYTTAGSDFAVGDLMLACVSKDNDALTNSNPADWTRVTAIQTGANAYEVWYKEADSGDTSETTYTWGSSTGQGWQLAILKATDANVVPVELTTKTGTSGPGTNEVEGSADTSIFLCSVGIDSNSVIVTIDSNIDTTLHNLQGATTQDCGLYVGYINPGSKTVPAITHALDASDQWGSSVVEIKEAGVAQQTITAGFIDNTSLYEPTLGGSITRTTDFISSTLIYDPSVGTFQTITPDFIDGTSLYEPTFTGSITSTADFIDGTSLYEPGVTSPSGITYKLALVNGRIVRLEETDKLFIVNGRIVETNSIVAAGDTIDADFISSTSLYEPTFTGTLTSTVDFIDGTVLYEPAVTSVSTLTADFIDSTSLYEPTFTGTITSTADFISSTLLHEPGVDSSYTLTADFIDGTSLYEPALTGTLTRTVDFIDGTVLYEPTFTGTLTVTADFIDSTSLYDPALSSANTLTADFIDSTSLYEPTFTGTLTRAADFIDGTTLYEPDVTSLVAGQINTDFIDSTSLYEPSFTGTITRTADFIDNTVLYEPTFTGSVTRTADFIDGTSLYEPSMEGSITRTADFIDGTVLYEPTFSGSITRTADFIDATALYEPVLTSSVTRTADFIDGTSLYEPGVTTAGVQQIGPGFISTTVLYQPIITGGAIVAPTGGGWLFDKKKTKKRYDLFKKNREKDAEADAEFMRMLLGERLQEGEALVVKNVQRDNQKKVLIKLDVESDIKKLAPKIRAAVPFPVMIQTLPRKVKKKRVITIDIIKQDDEQIFRMLEKLL